MKRISVIYATAGIGHKKASIAVKKALDEIGGKELEVELIDSLDYTNDFFKWSYLKAYLLMVNKLPFFWGISYHLTDNFYINLIVSKIRRISNWINSKKLAKHLADFNPNVIVSTHFFASEVVGDLKKRGLLNSRLITVVTDYRLHSWWLAPCTDMYVVGGEDARSDLLRWNVPPENIRILGIPIEPVFSKKLDKLQIMDKENLKKDIFTVLVVGGGFGVGPIEDIVKTVIQIKKPVQIVVVCGHNKELVSKIEAVRNTTDVPIKILGFVDNVYEYMEVSDILISKSGGITVSESLAKEIPLVVISPIIGQETRNSDFIVKRGASVKIDKVSDLKNLLEYLIDNPSKMRDMRQAIRTIKKPESCYDVAKLAVSMAG